MSTPPSTDRGFYVGYLPVPVRLLPFVRTVAIVGPLLAAALGLAWAFSQRSPGRAVWADTGLPVAVEGVLATDPVPALLVEGEAPWLLVEVGKVGSGARCRGLDGAVVRVSGWSLTRDGARMLELEPGPPGLTVLSASPADRAGPPEVDHGPVTLRGEIVDAKCYLGAMKPGDGRAHKACATLCIRGGIPAVFAGPRPTPGGGVMLLRDTSGGPLSPDLWEFIGEPIEVRGRLTSRGNLWLLTLGSGSARRL